MLTKIKAMLATKRAKLATVLTMFLVMLVGGAAPASAQPTPPADPQAADIADWTDYVFDYGTYLFNSVVARVIFLVVLAIGVSLIVRKMRSALRGNA